MVASLSLTREVAGSSPFSDNYFLSLKSLNSVKTFRKNSIVHFIFVDNRMTKKPNDEAPLFYLYNFHNFFNKNERSVISRIRP